jgi:hypothetical protein
VSRDSSVGIATGYELDRRGSVLGRGKIFFLFSTASGPALGPTKPPVQRVSGSHPPGAKQPDREVDHSPPSAEIKNVGGIHRDNFTFYVLLFIVFKKRLTYSSRTLGQ